jgi:hypothetical protein
MYAATSQRSAAYRRLAAAILGLDVESLTVRQRTQRTDAAVCDAAERSVCTCRRC